MKKIPYISPLTFSSAVEVMDKLNSGSTLITGTTDGKNIQVKNILKVKEEILYCYAVKENNTLILQIALKMIPEIYGAFYKETIAPYDIFEDNYNYFSTPDYTEYTWNFTHDRITDLSDLFGIITFL